MNRSSRKESTTQDLVDAGGHSAWIQIRSAIIHKILKPATPLGVASTAIGVGFLLVNEQTVVELALIGLDAIGIAVDRTPPLHTENDWNPKHIVGLVAIVGGLMIAAVSLLCSSIAARSRPTAAESKPEKERQRKRRFSKTGVFLAWTVVPVLALLFTVLLLVYSAERQSPIIWSTPYIQFEAEDFYVKTPGKVFRGTQDASISGDGADNKVHAIWRENGVEMRVLIYFRRTPDRNLLVSSHKGDFWFADEIRVHDGREDTYDWVTFHGAYFVSEDDGATSIDDVYTSDNFRLSGRGHHGDLVTLRFRGLKIKLFDEERASTSISASPSQNFGVVAVFQPQFLSVVPQE